MSDNVYPQAFTWESQGCKNDDASLALLHSEIHFYETVYNEIKETLDIGENIGSQVAIDDIKVNLDTKFRAVVLDLILIDETKRTIAYLRDTLSITIKYPSE